MSTSPAVASPGLLERIAAEPALAQLVLLVLLGLGAWFVVARLACRARDARSRAAVRDELLGLELYWCGDAPGAVQRLTRAMAANPEDAMARLAHALALGELGRAAEAHRQHVELRAGLGEHSYPNELGLARALLEAGHGADALQASERAAAMRPFDAAALELLARAAESAGWPGRAARAALDRVRHLPLGPDRECARQDAERLTEHAVTAALGKAAVDDAHRLAVALRSAVGDTAAAQRLALQVDVATRRHAITPAGAIRALSSTEVGAAGLLGELDSAARAADAIEANDAHVERLCDRFAAGDEDAAAELAELGARAVAPMFARAIALGPEDQRFQGLLRESGAEVLPALFAAFAELPGRHGRSASRRSALATTVLSRVVQSFGAEAAPVVAPLLEADDRELRKIAVDWFVALGDPQAFQTVVEVCAPVELLHRLNQVDGPALVRLLRALPRGHVVLDVLLGEAAFERDAELIDAIPGAAAPETIETLVVRRGPTRAVLRALIQRIAAPELGVVVQRVLRAFGPRALPQVVASYADLDRPAAQREALAELLDSSGAQVVPLVCDGFGASPSALDADLVARLVALGDAAVDPLLDAYRRGGLVQRLAGPLARRRTNRRERILQAIAAIGGRRGHLALSELMREETDADLKLRLAQRLHALEADSRQSRPARAEGSPKEDRGQAG